jgi:ligand-binding SRPBCC domain-containing protein
MSGRRHRHFVATDAASARATASADVGPTGPTPPGAGAHLAFGKRGRYHLLIARQWVPVQRDACFAFFADASKLEAITPPFLRFRILTPLPIDMRNGTLIEYRLSLLGLPLPWLSRIEDWRPGQGFTDVQLRGPYARWVHRHTFASADSGTWIGDEVEYDVPLAPCSAPVHALFVRPRLRGIFAFRQRAIGQLLG